MMSRFLIFTLFLSIVTSQTPMPPNPQQFSIHAGKPKGGAQIEVTTNYVDRLAGLFRIDVHNENVLTEQAFYYNNTKTGYLIYYDKNPPKCVKTMENYADMLSEWQKLPYAGRTRSYSHGKIECNMWNETDESWTWSYLASVNGNIPIEILDNSILISIFTNYSLGPDAVPKSVFDLPVPISSCKSKE